MAICRFFMEGRCRYGDRCWNEHPKGGGHRQEQSRYHYQQPPAGSRTWTSPNQRYVQPSSFSKSTTWSRDNSQPSFPSPSDPRDNRQYNSGSSAGLFSSQNRFSALPSQDHPRDTQPDKDGSLIEDIKRDLDVWESSGQWIFSSYCVIKDLRNLTGFVELSPEELRLAFYTARDSGNTQNYVNSVQQLASQWKQRIHAIKNTNISSQSALMNELTKPVTSSVPMFGGQQNSAFPTTSSSTISAAQPSVSFSFKPDSQFPTPSAMPVSSFPTAAGFGNIPATGFSNAATGSAASFTFAATTASNGASSGFGNAATAATFSFAPTTSSGAGASAFPGFAAATTTLPASTASSTKALFKGPPATFGEPTATFGGTSAPFGGTPVSSGFEQSATPDFAASTSGFGVLAGNMATPGFGARTSAVSDLFRAGAASSATIVPFGQPSAALVSHPQSLTTPAEASSGNPLFTSRSELSAGDLAQFESRRFTIGMIPLLPPPSFLLIV